MLEDWREWTRDAWQWNTKRNVKAINAETEQEEKEHKGERRRLRGWRQADVVAGFSCNPPRCSFVAMNRPILVKFLQPFSK